MSTFDTKTIERTLRYGGVCSLLALLGLSLSWELWLSPLRPSGSWLVLKAVPLLAPLRGLLHGRLYTNQWTAMLALPYLAEGVVRGWSDRGRSQALALIEVAFALLLFACTVLYAHHGRSMSRRSAAKASPPVEDSIGRYR